MAATQALKVVSDVHRRHVGETRSSELLERYRRDPFAHIEDGHVKILDLVSMEVVTLEPWQHQADAIRAWVDVDYLTRTGTCRWRTVIEEKSRQMGMTWILAWCELWALSYHNKSGLMMHIDGSEVDDGGSGSTPNSFLGKIRWMHGQMPSRFRAPLLFRYLQIRHEYNPFGFLDGETAGPDAGRGGRYARAIIDEAARIPFGESVHSALSRACPRGRFYNSTPKGDDNVYARLAKHTPRGYRKLYHHWAQHPVYKHRAHLAAVPDVDPQGKPQEQPKQPTADYRKAAEGCKLCAGTRAGLRWTPQAPRSHRFPGKVTSPWYDEAIEELTDDQVAMELDIDYSGSLSARVYPEFDEKYHVSVDPIPYERAIAGGEVELCIDFGLDTTSIVVFQDAPNELRAIAEVEVHDNATPDVVAPEIVQALRAKGVPGLLLEQTWTSRMLMVGDPAGEIREQVKGQTLVREYRRHGFTIRSRGRPIAVTLIAVKRLLLGNPKPLIISGPDCPNLVDHFKNNRWETDRQGSRKPDGKIRNDRHNHMLRGLAYFVAYKWPPTSTDEALGKATRRPSDEADMGGRPTGVGYRTRL